MYVCSSRKVVAHNYRSERGQGGWMHFFNIYIRMRNVSVFKEKKLFKTVNAHVFKLIHFVYVCHLYFSYLLFFYVRYKFIFHCNRHLQNSLLLTFTKGVRASEENVHYL